jgi:hypothetical protein
MEEWKPIKDFEDRYEISNHGRVRSKKKGLIMRPMNHYKGHLFVHLFKENKKKKMFIHRLVAIHFIVNIYGKEVVNHKDENKKNNHHTNLEWMTSGENTRYSIPTRMRKKNETTMQTMQ